MRRLFLAASLALAVVAGPAVVVPGSAPRARAAVLYAYTYWNGLRITWMWYPIPGAPGGGQWTMVGVEPYFGF